MSERPAPILDREILDFYARAPEEDRLAHGASLLEAARTRELIEQFAPPPPGVVLDVGGAAGAYSFWLAERGYTVHLVDASPRLIAEARRRGGDRPVLASSNVGDARALEFPDGAANIVLLLGPLYHLTEAEDRARALSEARRVLAPGGWLFAAVISRFASALDGLARDLLQDPSFAAIVRRDIEEGQHRNPTDRLDYFTTAYFHRPVEILTEVKQSGFADGRLFGIEGPGWLLPDVSERMADPSRRNGLLQVARLLQNEIATMGTSAHLLAIARKPT
jgi:ubiquinone/menaquinone biosynthesis C-methylase UbiE